MCSYSTKLKVTLNIKFKKHELIYTDENPLNIAIKLSHSLWKEETSSNNMNLFKQEEIITNYATPLKFPVTLDKEQMDLFMEEKI